MDTKTEFERAVKTAKLPQIAVFAVAVAAAAGLLAPLVLAFFGSDNLLVTTMKDDGFYFLKLAQNLAEGHGASFDGLGPTNGFHPLWAILLTPIFWLRTSNPMIHARIAIVLASVLNIAAAAAIRRAAGALAGPRTGWLAGLFYLAQPLTVSLVTSGMESALVILLVAILVGDWILYRQGRIDLAKRSTAIRFGLVAGLAMLARTDLIILVGMFGIGAFLRPGTTGSRDPRRFITRGLAASYVFLGIAAVVVAPWIVWNLAVFGTLSQVSARAHHLHATPALHLASAIGANVLQRARRTGLSIPVVLGFLATAPIGIALWIGDTMRRTEARQDLWPRLRAMDAPVLYTVVFVAAALAILGHFRSWYAAGPLAVGSILFSIPLRDLIGEGPPGWLRRVLSGILVCGLVLFALPTAWLLTREVLISNTATHAWREASEWATEHTQPGDRLASFNTGAFAYLTPRTVVNLDGVINNRILPWYDRHRLMDYLVEDHIRYVIDDPDYVGSNMGDYGGPGWSNRLVMVDKLKSKLRVYEVRP